MTQKVSLTGATSLNEEFKEEVKKAIQEIQEQKNNNKKEFSVLKEIKDDQNFLSFYEKFFILKKKCE